MYFSVLQVPSHMYTWSLDDVIKWEHFPRYWPFVWGIHRLPVNSPHKGQWRGALMFSLICTWINGWVNNLKAGDLRLHRAHYDVTVMQNFVSTLPTDAVAYTGVLCYAISKHSADRNPNMFSSMLFVTLMILRKHILTKHYNGVIMSAMASQITSLTSVYSTVYPVADQRKHQSSASLAFVRGIHRRPVNAPHKWPVTRKCFYFIVIMNAVIENDGQILIKSRRTSSDETGIIFIC